MVIALAPSSKVVVTLPFFTKSAALLILEKSPVNKFFLKLKTKVSSNKFVAFALALAYVNLPKFCGSKTLTLTFAPDLLFNGAFTVGVDEIPTMVKLNSLFC